MRGQAGRYLLWQVWDRAGPRILAGWFIALALTALIHTAIRNGAPPPDDAMTQMMAQMHQQIMWIVIIMMMHGIVASDRTLGFFRFYFAKPVSPVWFYGQSVLLALLGIIAASAGYVVFASLLIKALWPWHLLLNAIGLFCLFGMSVFVASNVSKHDWLWAILLMVVSAVVRGRFPAERDVTGRIFNAILPPYHLLGADQSLHASQWLWVGGWAVGLLLAGLAILRWRPIGEG